MCEKFVNSSGIQIVPEVVLPLSRIKKCSKVFLRNLINKFYLNKGFSNGNEEPCHDGYSTLASILSQILIASFLLLVIILLKYLPVVKMAQGDHAYFHFYIKRSFTMSV